MANVMNLEALDREAQVLRAAVDGKQLQEAKGLLSKLKVRLVCRRGRRMTLAVN